jgi:hypothetical protein
MRSILSDSLSNSFNESGCVAAGADPGSGAALAEPADRGFPAGLLESIQFEGPVAPEKQNEFKADFCNELTRLEQWAHDHRWPLAPVSQLHVIVSDRYRISKSLVPAWSGRPGHMEFPTWRVEARKSAIAHELVHVFYPNANRFLAEGFAVYLQDEIGGNPAFPNFGRPLHALVLEHLRGTLGECTQGDATSLDSLQLTALDAIGTPSPLTLRLGNVCFGEEPKGQGFIYPIAGSFMQHLVESRGLASFRALYERTPLEPLHQDAGPVSRWAEVYGASLATLEYEWKSMIAGRQG